MKHNILKSLFISVILLAGTSNVWASYVGKNVVIYMNNSASKWSYNYIYFGISYNDNYTLYQMEKVDNTQLYVHKRTDTTYDNYSNVVFFAATSSWGNSGGSYSNMRQYGANLTYTYNNYDFAGGKTYAISLNKKGEKTEGKQASITPIWLSDSNTGINYTQTLKAKVSTDNGTSYKDSNTPAMLTASSHVFTAYNSCKGTTGAIATLNAGNTSTTFKAGYTADTKLTAIEATGYTFDGWYSGSTKITSDLSTTVNPTGEIIYYAYYVANTYTVTLNNQGASTAGVASVTATYGAAMPSIANNLPKRLAIPLADIGQTQMVLAYNTTKQMVQAHRNGTRLLLLPSTPSGLPINTPCNSMAMEAQAVR